ncbi:MAG: M20/M25/M40 family metallo-hydrolase [Candidatus Hodarchaeales archaeon]|jgi:acetylornithine deacetylase/succinyl-diaminopimelate desuccinylase-like protein
MDLDNMVPLSFSELLELAPQYELTVHDILKELVKFPTVAYREVNAINDCADYLENLLSEYGYKVSQHPTRSDGHPVVFAEKDEGAEKTLLFYHHYDVQPEDPLDSWISSPWELTERDGRLFGRGAVDNKGNFVISLLAMKMLEDKLGKLPVNVKFVLEGEEEAGSESLPKFAKPHSDYLKADGCVWEGAAILPHEDNSLALPSPVELWCGLKGNAFFELKTKGPPQFPLTDVHSGYAAMTPNAAWRLVWALNTLKDDQERVLVEGFNELVNPPLKEDIEALKKYKGDLASLFKDNYNLDSLLLNRTGLDLYIPLFLEPSFSICGIYSGYQGPGSKTIVPAEATAKLDFRLVPDLTVSQVDQLLRNHLKKYGFDDINVRLMTGYEPAKTSVNHPFVKTLEKVMREITSPTPVNIIPFAPGSGPAYLFTPYTPLCMIINRVKGLNGHAPNENWPLNATKPSLALNAFIALSL